MARGNDDDFEEDDFSLSDGTEDDKDESASEASVTDGGADDAEEDDDDESGGDAEDDGSDFESAKPKTKKAKTSAAPKGKKAPPAIAASKAKSGKAPTVVAAKKVSGGAKAAAATTAKSGKPPAAKAAEKPAPSIKGDPTAHVLEYMRKTNRPYSMLNVFENLHRAIAKPALTKILDNLSDKGELASKLYGKAKIYYMNQDKLPMPSEDERRDVEDQIKQVEADCATLDQELKGAEGMLSSINAQISDTDLDQMLKQLEDDAVTLEKKLSNLERPDRPPIPAGRKDALKRKFTTYRTAWVTRKRIATEALNQIADGMEKKPKDVYNMIGIETDADVGIKEIPSI